MRKLLLFFFALLTGVSGAWAQTPVTSITSGKSYYFFNSCFDQFINSNWNTDRTLANAVKFTLTGSDGNYNIYSADKGGYLTWGTLDNGAVPTSSAATSENTLWTIDVQSGIIMNIYPKGQNSKELISTSTTAGKAIALWAYGNQGGQWYIYEAEDFEEIIAAKNSITSGTQYCIYTYNNGTTEGTTKYYLSETGYLTDQKASAGIFTFTATTSKGVVPTGMSWFVKNSSGTAFSNPEGSTRDNHIHQSSWNDRQDWDTQVFYLKDGKYAIRATNAAPDNTWYSNAFWKVDADDDASGLPDADYTLTTDEKHYVWQIEKASITVTYNIKMGGETVASATAEQLPGSAASMPTSLQNNYVTFGDPDVATVSDVNNVVNYTATLKDGFPFTYSTDYASAQWYYWKLNGSYISYAVSTPYPASTTKPTTDDGLWAFIGTPYGTKIINKAAGDTKYLQANSWAEMTTTATEWVIANNTAKADLAYFTVHAGATNYLNLQSSTLRYWNNAGGASDNGSTFTVEEYSEEYAGDVATYITPYFANHGSYFALKDAVYSANEATWTAATTTCDKSTYDALLDVVSNTSNLVWPETGYYLMKNNNSGTYLSTTTTPALSASTSTPATIVKLTNNGDGTYYIQSQGEYLAMSGSSVVRGETPVKFFVTLGTATKVSLTAEGSATSSYDNITSHGGTICGYPARGIATDPWSYWIVEDAATSVTVTLNSDGAGTPTYYATFCAPFSYTVSDATAYTMEASGDYLVPTAVVGEVAAGTPVLLKGASATATLALGTSYAATPVTSTALTGTYVAKTIAGATDYVLGIDEGVVGFYHWNSDELGANRAYVAESTPVKGFAIDWSGETGINAIGNVQSTDKAIYNIAGQRVQKAQKGLYIVNGKKMLVK